MLDLLLAYTIILAVLGLIAWGICVVIYKLCKKLLSVCFNLVSKDIP